MQRKLRVVIVVGARPNFMKAAPLLKAMRARGGFLPRLFHTGQHYDALMSDAFFRDLDLPKPHRSLGIGSGTQGEQTASILVALEREFGGARGGKPDLVVVVGDVNSTLAGALAAKKLGIPVAHIEAGLRSFDETMPEEINRMLTDRISDLLFTTEAAGGENLRREGVHRRKVHFVGNVMIDTLLGNREKIGRSSIIESLGLSGELYAVLTLHRPVNVDSERGLEKILASVSRATRGLTVVFPVHPRTRKQLEAMGTGVLRKRFPSLVITDPLGYLDFMRLVSGAKFVFTDSGGLQEETTALGVPCLTLRTTTERPVTVEMGTNTIVGTDEQKMRREVRRILAGKGKRGTMPKYWDGRASERIVRGILQHFRIL